VSPVALGQGASTTLPVYHVGFDAVYKILKLEAPIPLNLPAMEKEPFDSRGGIVQSIDAGRFTIVDDESKSIMTFSVNSDTRIVETFKVGDPVWVAFDYQNIHKKAIKARVVGMQKQGPDKPKFFWLTLKDKDTAERTARALIHLLSSCYVASVAAPANAKPAVPSPF
jgi:hypothetical protein